MVESSTVEVLRDKHGRRYELLPPEGGWGYMIALAITTFFSVTLVPVGVFGMIFGGFLKSIGDETFGTTMTNGVFNVVLSGTGLLSNHLLQKYSCRKVGLLGAVIFCAGAIATCFVTTLYQLILTWGVLQGFGLGLVMPACFTSFNGYFHRKQTVMMSTAQSLIGLIAMAWPKMIEKLQETYDWRQTQLIVSGLGLNCFVAMISLQPVKWHMKKRYIDELPPAPQPQLVPPSIFLEVPEPTNGTLNTTQETEEPLLDRVNGHGHSHHEHIANRLERRTPSILGIGNLATSITSIQNAGREDEGNEKKSVWRKIYDGLDLGLFKQPTFINISFGMALSLTADIAFLSLFPMILKNADFSDEDVTMIMTVYFASDLVGRVTFSFISAMMHVRNRYVVLIGAFFSAIFRIAFVSYDSYLWILIISAILGFLRSLIQIPLPLVIGEVYKDRFHSAFTLYMVVCAVVAAIFGPLLPMIKSLTESDIMVVHLLTFAYLLCAIPWTIELLFERKTK